MTYKEAKGLHNGEEVISKEDGRSLFVVQIKVDAPVKKTVSILCNDGIWYNHSEFW